MVFLSYNFRLEIFWKYCGSYMFKDTVVDVRYLYIFIFRYLLISNCKDKNSGSVVVQLWLSYNLPREAKVRRIIGKKTWERALLLERIPPSREFVSSSSSTACSLLSVL